MYESKSFTGRLNQLLQESDLTREEFAKRCQVSGSALTNYLNGSRTPDAAKIKPICEEFSVSADWLLGLSDVRNPSAELKGVVDFTGLSEDAVNKIVSLSSKRKTISHLIEANAFGKLVENYSIFIDLLEKLKQKGAMELPAYEMTDDGKVVLNADGAIQHFNRNVSIAMGHICDDDYYTVLNRLDVKERVDMDKLDRKAIEKEIKSIESEMSYLADNKRFYEDILHTL